MGEGTNNVWYDYGRKIWANIVTVTGNEVTYWTWIPRYMYIENTSAGTTDIRFVDENDKYYEDIDGVKTEQPTTGYTLADSFKFGDVEGETDNRANIYGYWASKYEIQAELGNELIYTSVKGTSSNEISKEVTTTNPSGKYTIFVEGIKKAENVDLPYTVTGLKKKKKYDICVVSETNKKMIGRTTSSADNIEVDYSKFEPECTYYVTYDENGNNETIAGRLDKIKEPENWYDYSRKIWANLVTVKGNNVTYWTYIPRYEYVDGGSSSQLTEVHFIPYTQKTARHGYTIPESFIFGKDVQGNDIHIKGYWASKYEVQKID